MTENIATIFAVGFAFGMMFIGNGIGKFGEGISNMAETLKDIYDDYIERRYPEGEEE